MELKVNINPDPATLAARLKGDVGSAIRAGMTNLTSEIEARAVKLTPVKTSNLVNSITNLITGSGGSLTGTVKATAPYASFVHEGTGLFGPHHQKIVPVKAKALNIPGIGFRRSVKGMKGRPFFDLALKGLNPQQIFDDGIQNFLTAKGW